jgi:hypothetical protein
MTMAGSDLTERRGKRAKRPYNTQRVPRDHAFIDVANAAELAYWCANFRCTGSQLREAVTAVGPSVKLALRYLQTHARPSHLTVPDDNASSHGPERKGLHRDSTVRDVVESSVGGRVPPRHQSRVTMLTRQVFAHPQVEPRLDQRWVTLSRVETAAVVCVIDDAVSQLRTLADGD